MTVTKNSKASMLVSRMACCTRLSRAYKRSQHGETLAETLIGLLIAALSLIMLTTAVATASRIIIMARDMSDVYESSTQTLAPATGTQESSGVVIKSDGSLGESYGSNGLTVSVTYVDHDLPGAITGIAYEQSPSPSEEGGE